MAMSEVPQRVTGCSLKPFFALYRERNLIERFFNKIKHFRAMASRYDKLARNLIAAVQLVSAIIPLN